MREFEEALEEVEFIVDISSSFASVINSGMMLGEVISIIVHPLVPIEMKLALGLSVLEPIIPHIP